MTGRPSTYTLETAAAICERIADGESLKAICASEDMPARSTVFKWLAEQPGFSDMYVRARDEQADALADDMLAIADQYDTTSEALNPDMIQRAKLRIDTRKWVAAKLKPKKYGEKQEIEQTVNMKLSLTEMSDEELAAIAVGKV